MIIASGHSISVGLVTRGLGDSDGPRTAEFALDEDARCRYIGDAFVLDVDTVFIDTFFWSKTVLGTELLKNVQFEISPTINIQARKTRKRSRKERGQHFEEPGNEEDKKIFDMLYEEDVRKALNPSYAPRLRMEPDGSVISLR